MKNVKQNRMASASRFVEVAACMPWWKRRAFTNKSDRQSILSKEIQKRTSSSVVPLCHNLFKLTCPIVRSISPAVLPLFGCRTRSFPLPAAASACFHCHWIKPSLIRLARFCCKRISRAVNPAPSSNWLCCQPLGISWRFYKKDQGHVSIWGSKQARGMCNLNSESKSQTPKRPADLLQTPCLALRFGCFFVDSCHSYYLYVHIHTWYHTSTCTIHSPISQRKTESIATGFG